MTGIIHARASVPEDGGPWNLFFCRVSGLRGVASTAPLELAGEDCGFKVEPLCLKGRTVRFVPAVRALSRYL